MKSQDKALIGQLLSAGKPLELNCTELVLTGPDAVDYFDRQTTNVLKSETFHWNTVLDPVGKIIGYGLSTLSEGKAFFYVPKTIANQVKERIEKFIIMEEVELESSEKTLQVSFPDSIEAKNLVHGNFLPLKVVIGGENKSNKRNSVWSLLGFPDWDEDLLSGVLLNNSNLEFLGWDRKKGCFLGQETVSKIDSGRGGANYPMLLAFESETSTPIAGEKLLVEGNSIGEFFTSMNFEGRDYWLCSLKRQYRVENSVLKIEGVDQEATVLSILSWPDQRELSEDLLKWGADFFASEASGEIVEKYLTGAIIADPTNADAYEALGVFLGRQERFHEAIDWMNRMQELNPSSVMPHTNKSMFHMKLGNIEEAEKEKADATLKTFTSLGDEAEAKRAREQKEQQDQLDRQRRAEMFQEVLEIDPDDTLANNGLGHLLLEEKKFDQAITHFEVVLKQDPKYSVAYLGLGQGLVEKQMWEKAKNILKEGIKVASAQGDLMPANQMQAILNKTNQINS